MLRWSMQLKPIVQLYLIIYDFNHLSLVSQSLLVHFTFPQTEAFALEKFYRFSDTVNSLS